MHEPAPDPILGPATRLLWRGPGSVHLERGRHAVVVDGLPAAVVARIAGGGAPEPGGAEPAVADALQTLTRSGHLWSRPPARGGGGPDTGDIRLAPPAPRLAADLASLAVRHGERAAEVLHARAHACVALVGEDRLAIQLAALLAAAGVGHVRYAPMGRARLRHAAPGGVLVEDEGGDLAAAAERAIRRAAPEPATTSPPAEPDLTVLVGHGPVDDTHRDALHARGAAHLVVTVGADHGSVGPLVLPGLTSCLRCADLHRTDRDPAWPALAAQLAVPRRYAPPSDVAVTALLASVAALQTLAFLDGEDPATVEGTLEIELPDWRLRRRPWPVHPACECCT